MESLYTIQDAVCERLHEIADEIRKRGGLPDSCIEATDKLTHTLKSVVTTIAMYEGGYSEDGGGYSGRGSYDGGSSSMSMDGGNGGYSGRRGRSRTTGRFVSRDGGMSGNGYSGRRMYSRDDGQNQLMEELQRIANDTNDNAVRQRLNELRQRMNGGQ